MILDVPKLCSYCSDVAYFSRARFGTGSGPIYLDDVNCIGSELGLVNCSHSRHTADCTHSEDAGVRCQTNCKYQTIDYYGNIVVMRIAVVASQNTNGIHWLLLGHYTLQVA